MDTKPYARKTRKPKPSGQTNGLAITSLIFGILTYVLLPLIGALIAIITGHIARAQIKRNEQEGAGLALAGLILGYIYMLIVVLVIIAAIALPAYQDYVLRHNMETATATLAVQRHQLAQTIMAAPDKKTEFNQNIELDATASAYWQNAVIEQGDIWLQLATQKPVATQLQGKTLLLRPELADGKIIWHCELDKPVRQSVYPQFCIQRNR